MKREYSVGINYNVNALIEYIVSYLQNEKRMETNLFSSSDCKWILQSRESRGWRKNLGMDKALTIKIMLENGVMQVETGEGKWLDKSKVAAASVSWFFCWPAIIPVAIGTVEQAKIFSEVINKIDEYVFNNVSYPKNFNTSANTCYFCGASFKTGANFCDVCGKKLN